MDIYTYIDKCDNNETYHRASKHLGRFHRLNDKEVTDTKKAMARLNKNDVSLIYLRYILGKERMAILKTTDISERTYHRNINKALFNFALAYDGGKLLAVND